MPARLSAECHCKYFTLLDAAVSETALDLCRKKSKRHRLFVHAGRTAVSRWPGTHILFVYLAVQAVISQTNTWTCKHANSNQPNYLKATPTVPVVQKMLPNTRSPDWQHTSSRASLWPPTLCREQRLPPHPTEAALLQSRLCVPLSSGSSVTRRH